MADATPARYHSHRRKQQLADEPPAPSVAAPADDILARSKSRYRRTQQPVPAAASQSEPIAPSQSDQQQQTAPPSRYHSKHRQSNLNTLYSEKVVEAPAPLRRPSAAVKQSEREGNEPLAQPAARDPQNSAGKEAERTQRKRSNGRQPTPKHISASSPPPPAQVSPPISQPSGELFPPLPKPAESPVRLDGPPQSSKIRATKSMTELPRVDDQSQGGCFGGMFKRRKAEPLPADNGTAIARPKTAKGDPSAIRQGRMLGIDAPVSAINSGDRHVLVECGKSKTLFPVTPSTTPVDLIKTAATCMSERIDVKSALLLESFGTVGVQRPLRRYEHIRDVMNSWDNDKENSLILVDPGTGSVEPELTTTGVPSSEPGEQSWLLSYSQKVGKWDRRVITLRTGGQIVSQKDPEKPGDAVNVCHLSDFDIYSPSPEKLKKKIKPPKKLCYAIKSQQKTSLFESTENFVHFFSTGDRGTADSFYYAVQGWRSWYLVNVMGEGKRETEKPKVAAPIFEKRDRTTSNDYAKKHRVQGSMESHYQLGSFRPLMIDMDDFDRRPPSSRSENEQLGASGGFAKSANQFDINVSPERRVSSSRRQHPPLSLSNKVQLADDEPLANLNRKSSVARRRSSTDQKRPDTSEFRDTGLLGRSYSQRRQEQVERETQAQEPFTSGPSLLNPGTGSPGDGSSRMSDGLRRQSSTRKQASSTGDLKRSSSSRAGPNRGNSIDLDRSQSRRQMPKPLVDLTPQYREPPQHSRKGRGFQPEQLKAGGLIADATTPEDPLGLPVSTVFRKTSGTHNVPSSPGLVDLTPQHQEPTHHARKGRGYKPENITASGGLVGSATSPEDPLGLPQNTIFKSLNAMPEGRRRTGSVSETAQPMQGRSSVSKAPEAFTGEGLLASHKQGWGTETKGRGVIDGSHAGGKPLVDLSETTRFAGGSLLAKVEKAEPIPAPIIDREKRIERDVKYGEGY